MLERVEKKVVRNSAILEMLGKNEVEKSEEERVNEDYKEEEKLNSREKNPKAYERYRGTGGTKAMSYYLSDRLVKALNLKAAIEEKDKSEIVREALTLYLQDELAEVERLKERGK